MAVWKGSLLCRFLSYLMAIWPDSAVCRLGACLRRIWRGSLLYRPLTRALDSEPEACEASLLARLVTRFHAWLHGFTRLRAAVHSSLAARIYGALLRVCAGSRLLGWAFRGGMGRILLVLLALYVPVDYFLRDVLPIPLLGSVWDELLLLLCVAWALWMRMDGKVACKARITPLHVPVLLFLLIGLAEMLLVSPYFSIAVSGYRATVQYILWFFVVVSLLRSDGDFFAVYGTFVAVGLVIALHGIYQYIIAVPIPSSWMSSSEQSVRTRVYSIFGSPNIMGDFMVMVAPLAAGLFFYCKKAWQKLLFAAVTFCMCLACLFTMSRGAWIALAVAVLIFVAIIDRRLLAAAVVCCVGALFLPFVWSRVSYLFSEDFWYLSTNGGRASRWGLGISYLYRTNPVFGIGLGMFGGAVAMQNRALHWIWYTYVDNYYLRIFAEMGWVGIVSYACMMLALLVTGVRSCYRLREQKREKALAAGIFSALAGVLTHCFFENIFEEPYMMACFWILAALLCYLGFLRPRSTVTQR